MQTQPLPGIAIHGGAGSVARPGEDEAAARSALRAALDTGWKVLAAGGPALDAAVAAVASLEASGVFNAGRGAVRASDQSVSLDAAVMDGATRRVGAVGALTGFPGAIEIARRVMEATPHVLLVGPGAESFADAQGFARASASTFVAPPFAPDPPAGTVGAVARDAAGRFAAATATGGLRGKRPGRVGDSPIVGAGTYADQRCAISATGLGEAFMRSVFGFRVATLIERGVPLEAATRQALEDVATLGGHGGCVAIDDRGAYAMPFDTACMYRGKQDGAGALIAIGRDDTP